MGTDKKYSNHLVTEYKIKNTLYTFLVANYIFILAVMSERKVLNKYYPPDFDPTKLPKLKRERNRQFVIRIMAPFSMRCKTCGEYIYKGRKFNARVETAEGENYLGLRIYRFYIRCTKCISEITFK